MPSPRRTLTFLHLSDIHVGHGAPRNRWDQEIVLQAVLDDAAVLQVGHVDAILVTGDIAFSGREIQYARAREWLGSLIEMTSVSPENVFLVPGNHDVERSVCAQGRNATYLESLRRGELLLDDVFDSNDFAEISAARFANYLDLATHYAPEAATVAEWRAVRYLTSDGLVSDAGARPGACPVTILGLNTALLAQGEDVGRMAVGLRPWRTLQAVEASRRSLTLLLSHHPLENVATEQWLCRREVDQGSQLARSVHISLCGHVHRADVQRTASIEGDSLRLVAGAIHDDLPESVDGLPIPRTHSYTFGTVSLSESKWSVDVVPRIWSRTRREFQPNHDVSGPAANSARFDLRVPGPSAVKPAWAHRPRRRRPAVPASAGHADHRDDDLYFQPWLKYIPERVFSSGVSGFNELFQAHIYENLRKSHYYYYKGDTARVTSVELSSLLVDMTELTDIKLLLLYPDDDSVRRRLNSEKRRRITDAEVRAFRDDLYATLFGLVSMAKNGLLDSRSLEVSFYREDSYYRVEAMRNGAYLTYFLQGGTHGTTFFYPPSRQPGFGMFETLTQAFRSAFGYAQERAELVFRRRSMSGAIPGSDGRTVAIEDSLSDVISLLGGTESIEYYSAIWGQRRAELDGEVVQHVD